MPATHIALNKYFEVHLFKRKYQCGIAWPMIVYLRIFVDQPICQEICAVCETQSFNIYSDVIFFLSSKPVHAILVPVTNA